MKIFFNKKQLIKIINKEKDLGFVPTMGSLHDGHMSLFKKSLSQCDKTIVSIFINKPQFNRKIDFKKYPKSIKDDILKLKKIKVDYLYIPSNNQIYPNGSNKKIKIHPFAKKLCGKSRPGHFEAVADVIERLITIIKPNRIYFGKKDFQQLVVLEDFIKNKFSDIKVVGCKIIRDKNGVPLSSRNQLLSLKEREIASKIYRILFLNKERIIKKKTYFNNFKKEIIKLGVSKIDYLKIININKIVKPYNSSKKKIKIFLAYYLRKTRLIDNI